MDQDERAIQSLNLSEKILKTIRPGMITCPKKATVYSPGELGSVPRHQRRRFRRGTKPIRFRAGQGTAPVHHPQLRRDVG
jgi:hypothetical protein